MAGANRRVLLDLSIIYWIVVLILLILDVVHVVAHLPEHTSTRHDSYLTSDAVQLEHASWLQQWRCGNVSSNS